MIITMTNNHIHLEFDVLPKASAGGAVVGTAVVGTGVAGAGVVGPSTNAVLATTGVVTTSIGKVL